MERKVEAKLEQNPESGFPEFHLTVRIDGRIQVEAWTRDMEQAKRWKAQQES